MARDLDSLNPWTVAEAAKVRKKRLADLRSVVRLCVCEWPLHVYRNGDGHHPDCPAHNGRGTLS